MGLVRVTCVFRPIRWLAALGAVAALKGCAPRPINPSFPVQPDAAEVMLEEMRETPIGLERPVVVVPGFLDVTGTGHSIARRLAGLTDGDESMFVVVDLGGCLTFDSCRNRLFEAVDALARAARAPGEGGDNGEGLEDGETVEVDVVAYSMGGLVARYAALRLDPGQDAAACQPARRLRIRRLFTISSPHQGAMLASREAVVPLVRDMASGSPFLARLDDALPGVEYELIPYVLMEDAVVGAERAAPNGSDAIWAHARPFTMPHVSAHSDPRILADIARRLRGEPSLVVIGRQR